MKKEVCGKVGCSPAKATGHHHPKPPPSPQCPTALLAMLVNSSVETFKAATEDIWSWQKTMGVFPFDEPIQRWVLLALINKLCNLSQTLSLLVLPWQSYELPEWWEAQLRQ